MPEPIAFHIEGTDRLMARFAAMSPGVRERVKATVASETEAVRVAALDRMAELFRNAGGKMRDTLSTSVEDNGEQITGTVAASGLPYLAIQEYGGVTKPHDIFPVNAAVLAFLWNGVPVAIKGDLNGSGKAYFRKGGETGDMVFAKHVSHPGSVMPERSYLRAALVQRRKAIREAFLASVHDGMAGD